MLEVVPLLSIAAATLPATPAVPEATPAVLAVVFAVMAVVAAGVTTAAYFLGAFRRGVADGPDRLYGGRPAWPTGVSLLAGFVSLFLVATAASVVYQLSTATATEAVEPPGDPPATDALTPQQTLRAIQIQVVAYGVFVGVALGVHAIFRRFGLAGPLGLRVGGVPRGLLFGVLAMLVVLPWVYAAGIGVGAARLALGFEEEAIHPLLKTMRDESSLSTLLWGAFAAAIMAPFAEEILFRGFLQTWIVYSLARLAGRRVEDAVAVEEDAPFAPPSAVLLYASKPPPLPTPGPTAVQRWLGIILAGLLFTLVHPPWSWPLIFLLALGFGYAYERTGNLWTSIAMHFVFNAISTGFLLLSLQ